MAVSDPVEIPRKPPHYVWVVNQGYDSAVGGNSLSVINPNQIGSPNNGLVKRIPVGSNPTDVAVTPDGLYVIVTNTGEGTVSFIDAITLTEVDLVPDDPAFPQTLGVQRLRLRRARLLIERTFLPDDEGR